MDELNIIIPGAGLGRRMKSYGPKPLIEVEGKTLISRQINILGKIYPNSKIILVNGFEHEKVKGYIETNFSGQHVKIVTNYKYSTTNVSKSISMAAEKYPANKYLIVYGDLIFSSNTMNIEFSNSGILEDTNNEFDSMEIGFKEKDGIIEKFSYSDIKKWAQIAFFNKEDMNLFTKIVNNTPHDKFLSFEIMNIMIDYYHTKLKVYTNKNMSIKEIDDSADIEKARELAKGGKF